MYNVPRFLYIELFLLILLPYRLDTGQQLPEKVWHITEKVIGKIVLTRRIVQGSRPGP